MLRPSFIFSGANFLCCFSAYFTPMSYLVLKPLVLAWEAGNINTGLFRHVLYCVSIRELTVAASDKSFSWRNNSHHMTFQWCTYCTSLTHCQFEIYGWMLVQIGRFLTVTFRNQYPPIRPGRWVWIGPVCGSCSQRDRWLQRCRGVWVHNQRWLSQSYWYSQAETQERKKQTYSREWEINKWAILNPHHQEMWHFY